MSKSVRVTIHQPAYLPWLGYFDKLLHADTFIFLDTVRLDRAGRNRFNNRNRIKGLDGREVWLTVPVKKAPEETPVQEIEVDNSQEWRDRHLRLIKMHYYKAPEFGVKFARLQKLYYDETYVTLSDLCFKHLAFWVKHLGLDLKMVRASQLPPAGVKSVMNLNLCQATGATDYISGPNGRDYLDLASFEAANVKVHYQEFVHPVYPQINGPFLPQMGIVDFYMNLKDPATALYDLMTGSGTGEVTQKEREKAAL
jgi:hypothetical protein